MAINRESSIVGSFHTISTGGLDPRFDLVRAPSGTIGLKFSDPPALFQKLDDGDTLNWVLILSEENPINGVPQIPAFIEPLRLWLDADSVGFDGSLIDGSNRVLSWRDRASGFFNATQDAVSARPIFVHGALNGRTVIRFAGSHELEIENFQGLYNALKGGYSLYSVSLQNTPNNESILRMNGPGSDDYVHEYRSGNDMRFRPGSGTPLTANFTAIENPPGVFHIFRFLRESNIVSIRIFDTDSERSTTGSTDIGSTPTDGFVGSAGGSSFLNGDIAELLVFNRKLTESEESLLLRYFSFKWGI